MSTQQIQITADDVSALRQIEDRFNRQLWAQLDGDDRHYQLFEQNLGLRGHCRAAFHTLVADIEQGRREKANSAKIVRHLSHAFDAMLPSLTKSFGEASLLKALPDQATDARMIAICKQVGAKGLAGLCEKKAQKTPAT